MTFENLIIRYAVVTIENLKTAIFVHSILWMRKRESIIKIPRFPYSNSYTIYWGVGGWCETCTISNTYHYLRNFCVLL